MWLVKLLFGLALAYTALVAVTYWAQTRILFAAGIAGGAPDVLPAGGKLDMIRTPDGTELAIVRYPASDPDSGRPLVLGFGGNAWNATAMGLTMHQLFPDHPVAALYYRGYAPSGGKPSAKALLADAAAVYDGIDASNGVVAVGFSIGAGIAARLATERPVDGLILVTPFDSLTELARHHYPWAPVGLLLRHRIDTAEYLKSVDAPTAVIVAGQDTIVPAARSAPVPGVARQLVFSETVPGAGHNDLYDRPEFKRAMRTALETIEAQEDGKASGD